MYKHMESNSPFYMKCKTYEVQNIRVRASVAVNFGSNLILHWCLHIRVQPNPKLQNQCSGNRMLQPMDMNDSLELCGEHQGRVREYWCQDDRQLVTSQNMMLKDTTLHFAGMLRLPNTRLPSRAQCCSVQNKHEKGNFKRQ